MSALAGCLWSVPSTVQEPTTVQVTGVKQDTAVEKRAAVPITMNSGVSQLTTFKL